MLFVRPRFGISGSLHRCGLNQLARLTWTVAGVGVCWLIGGAISPLIAGTLVADSRGGTETARVSRRHPVSIVEADIYVQQTKIIMKLRCFADDLELLQGVTPLADGSYDLQEIAEATQDHAQFLAERISILDAQGQRLTPQIIEVNPPTAPPEGIQQGRLMEMYCSFELEYALATPPEFITINQTMLGEGYLFPSELKILLKQAGSDTPYLHVMKPEQPETFRFDWSNPVLDSDASEAEWSTWFEEQREATLGITSYSSVYSFVYITPFEVRHEILIPLASLATVIDFERSDPSFLEIAEQDLAREKIEAFFSVDNDVVIDGVPVRPVFDRIDFYGLELRDFAMQAERRKISMANGRIGIIMSYGTKSAPQQVQLTWNLFNEAIRTVDSVIFAFNGNDKTQFSTFLAENIYRWQNDTAVPLPEISAVPPEQRPITWPLGWYGACAAAALCVVIAATRRQGWLVFVALAFVSLGWWGRQDFGVWTQNQLTVAESDSVFRRLHQNIFRAFDYHDEEAVYSALATSVDGDLLQDLYLQIFRHLQMQDQGGAVAKIEQVEFISGESRPTRQGFDFRCTWNLVGTVEHWGHIHQRTHQFDADFSVELRGEAWKITRMQGLDERQIGVKTSLRQF